jgi:hypothetical protein
MATNIGRIGGGTIEATLLRFDPMPDRLARQVLKAPAFVRRAAAARVSDPVERWMLRQPDATRASYVREVLDRGGDDRLAEIWMLRQPDKVRESYVKEVLEPQLPPKLHSSRP